MKQQRFLYLMGVLGVICGVLAVLFLTVFRSVGQVEGATAVSPFSSPETKQVGLEDGWLTAVSAQVKEAEYAISVAAETQAVMYQSPNRAQNLRTYYSETGIQVEPRVGQGAAWQFGLELMGVGDGQQKIAPELVAHEAAGNKVTLDYGDWQAWYVNEVRGVEQGFTLATPLFAQETGVVQVDMALTGNLVAQAIGDEAVALVTAVGEQVLTYHGLIAVDARGAELPAVMSILDLGNGRSGIRLSVDVAQAEYPIVVDPFLGGGVDWQGWTDQDANYGFAVSTAGDVNGDGFDDVLVGANWFDAGTGPGNEGAVFAYYGSPEGLSQTEQWSIVGDAPQNELGYAVNPAGDVNGDGFADVIIGTHLAPRGKAYVYLGGATGLSAQPVWVGVGEQDDDGFGTAVNTAGDVDGDGYDDIIIGAPYYDLGPTYGLNNGRAYVFSGEDVQAGVIDPSGAWQVENDLSDSSASFGYAVGTAGDVDQDGYDDVIIGAPFSTPTGFGKFAAIYSGSAEGLIGGWGSVVSVYDGDWLAQIVSPANSAFGFSVAAAGDVNGDGLDDVVVGSPNYDETDTGNPAGAVFVYLGVNPISYMSINADPDWTILSGSPGAMLGHDVGTAGDVDQDGYDDIIAGAPQFDYDYPGFANALNAGGAFVYRGSPTGLNSSWLLYSNEADAKLGTSVGTAGDVNGDGYADVIIGAPEMPGPASTAGQAFSVYGSGQIAGLQAYNDSPTALGASTKLWAEVAEGGVLNYEWDLGDGSVADTAVVEHIYAHPGTFTAVITATSLTDQITATTAVTVSKNTLIDPISGGHLEFVNEETGFGTKVDVPPGAVTELLKLSYTPLTTITQSSPTNSLGYYFDLDVAPPVFEHQVFLPIVMKGGGSGGTAVADLNSPTSSYTFAKPVTVTIVYNDAGLTLEQELSLKLPYWNKELQEWVDITVDCGLEGTYLYYPEDNYFTVEVCHLSRFAVVH